MEWRADRWPAKAPLSDRSWDKEWASTTSTRGKARSRSGSKPRGEDRAPEGKWRPETSVRGVAPSRGDVIKAEIADVNGRAAGKVMLEAIEVEPAQEAGIFARVACTGVVDPELGDYAVQILGMGKDRKEFVVHLCAPQEPGRCGETGAALHCEKWTVFPGEAGRGVDAESAEASRRTGRGLRPEMAGELGLDPPVRLIEPKNLNAPRSSQLEGRDGDLTPRGEAWRPSGRNKDVESRVSRDILPSAVYWTPPTASTPLVSAQDPPLEMVLKEIIERGTCAFSSAPRAQFSLCSWWDADQVSVLTLKYSIAHDFVVTWDDLENIGHHTFSYEFWVVSEEHLIGFTGAPVNLKTNVHDAVHVRDVQGGRHLCGDPGWFVSVCYETRNAHRDGFVLRQGHVVWHHRLPKDRREHDQGVDCIATIHDEFKVVDPPVRRFSGEELEDLSCRPSVTSSLCGPRSKSTTQLGGEASTFSPHKLRSAPETHPFLLT